MSTGPSKKTIQYVMDSLTERQERLYALAMAIENELTPEDEKNPPANHPEQAWRLTQVLTDILNDTEEFNALKKLLLGDSNG
jgi:hypothetical protein